MEYLITFDDGSDGYLSHHGVLGMKWGVRNAETQARYAGGTVKTRSSGKKKKIAKAAIIAGGALTVAVIAGTPQGRALAKKGASAVAKTLKRSSKRSVAKPKNTGYDEFKPDVFTPDTFKPDVFTPKTITPKTITPKTIRLR